MENDEVMTEDKGLLSTLAKLLNSTVEEIKKALLYRIVAARGEIMEKGHSVDEAYYGRDALCKVGHSGMILYRGRRRVRTFRDDFVPKGRRGQENLKGDLLKETNLDCCGQCIFRN